jgi:hypothetical protein
MLARLIEDHLIRSYEFRRQTPLQGADARASAIASDATEKTQEVGGSVQGSHLSLLVSARTSVKDSKAPKRLRKDNGCRRPFALLVAEDGKR